MINGRSWGVYANVQQFNKEFVAEHYGSSKGARWKVSGNPQADGDSDTSAKTCPVIASDSKSSQRTIPSPGRP
ncbi:MAG: hypothetical protein Ct9H300mP1_28530 [Planctomycetaceae bacterium]|nr:MAG: hypothetical protein Ct9H300mP1_28530 [Planctomycetaceae bacterium]